MLKLEQLAERAAQAAVFALPIVGASNLFLVLCQRCGFVRGLRSDYLLPRLYAVDIVLLILIVSLAILVLRQTALIPLLKQNLLNNRRLVATISGLLVILILRQLLSPFPLAALTNLTQLLSLTLVGILLFLLKRRQRTPLITLAVAGVATSAVLQSLLGLYQFYTQHSLLPYQFLGETRLTNTLVTRISFAGASVIPAHGSTAHPNILAGFLAIFSVILVRFGVTYKGHERAIVNALLTVPITLSIATIFYTQSFAGTMVMIIGGILLLFEQTPLTTRLTTHLRKVLALFFSGALAISIVTVYLPTQIDGSNSLFRRQYLLETSWNLLKQPQYFLFGTGISQFTAVAEEYSPTTEIVRFNQPVHHALWLVVTELGVGTSLLLILAVILLTKNTISTNQKWNLLFVLFLISPVLVWDHYLWNLESGRALLLISVITFFSQTNSAKN